MSNSFTTAELVIYALLSLPILFVLFKHGARGILGWGYLSIFATIRILGGILALAHVKYAGVVSSIGLSPLLLGVCGVLHEARMYRTSSLNKTFEWILIIKYHAGVSIGMVLLIIGIVHQESGKGKPSDATLIDVGIVIVTVLYVALVFGALWTQRVTGKSVTEKTTTTGAHAESTKLVYGVLGALVFLGVRVIYTLIALTTKKANLNPTTGSLAIRVILSLLMELLTVLCLLGAGLATREIRRFRKTDGGQALAQPLNQPGNYAYARAQSDDA